MELKKEKILRLLPELAPDRLIILEETDSTNLLAKRLAKDGAPDGTVILAGRQTAGRGSAGRGFSSPEGGLYLTVLLRPELAPERLLLLTPMMAVAACEAVGQCCGFLPGIKWVNDLVRNGRKLAGLLAETTLAPDGTVSCVAAGVGINCDAPAEALPGELQRTAIGLREITGEPTDQNALAAALARQLLLARDDLLAGKTARWIARYRELCITPGNDVLVQSENGGYRAYAERVDDDGALIVTDQTGTRRRIACGTVSVRGLYGYVDEEQEGKR